MTTRTPESVARELFAGGTHTLREIPAYCASAVAARCMDEADIDDERARYIGRALTRQWVIGRIRGLDLYDRGPAMQSIALAAIAHITSGAWTEIESELARLVEQAEDTTDVRATDPETGIPTHGEI